MSKRKSQDPSLFDSDADGGLPPPPAGDDIVSLHEAAPGRTGWTIPIDPLLRVWENPDAWKPVLAILYARAV